MWIFLPNNRVETCKSSFYLEFWNSSVRTARNAKPANLIAPYGFKIYAPHNDTPLIFALLSFLRELCGICYVLWSIGDYVWKI